MAGCYFYHTFFVELLIVVVLFIINLINFFTSFPTITLTEIKNDFSSHPILSLSSDNAVDTFFLLEPLISFRSSSGGCKYPFGKKLSEVVTFNEVNLTYTVSKKTYGEYRKDSVKKGEHCKEGYKQCGILDSLNNTMCITVDEQCPINSIYITNNEQSPDDGYTYHTIKINSQYIHYTNEATDNPIVVKFAWNNTRNVLSLFPFEPNDDNDFFTCSFRPTVQYNYSLYQYLSNDTLYRPYIGISDSCLSDSTFLLEERRKVYESLTSIQWGLLACDIILFLVDLAVVGYSIYIMLDTITYITYTLIRIPLYLSLITIFILNLLTLLKVTPIKPKVTCYDEVTNYELNYFSSETQSDLYCIISIIEIPLLIIETNIAMVIFKIKDAKKAAEGKLNQDTMIEAKDMSVSDKL